MNQHRSKDVIEKLETSIAFGSGQHFGSTGNGHITQEAHTHAHRREK